MHLHLRVGLGVERAARAPDVERSHDERGSESQPRHAPPRQQVPLQTTPLPPPPNQRMAHSPLKGGEGSRSLGDVAHVPEADAVAEQGGQGDEAGEPEQHGQRLGGEDGELVRGGGDAPGREDEVEQREEGPDGGEDEEVDLGGRVAVPVAGPPCRDCERGGRRVSRRRAGAEEGGRREVP